MTFPILPSNSAVGGYQVQRSLRFNSADSAYLNRTPSVAGNRRTWTWSGWVKRSNLDGWQRVLEVGSSNADRTVIGFDSSAKLEFFNAISSVFAALVTTQVFRDVTAWYHIVVAMDTTQATASDRTKFYVNGVQITSFTTSNYVTQNADTYVDASIIHRIGDQHSGGNVFNGYMTEVNLIDGQALTPSSFGETNATTGQWQPKKYTGTYGTNGFYLNFSDNSGTTATTLGKDYSGNGNNWTPNNFSVTPGAGNDSMIDVPTNWADGGNGRGNYCTLNPLDKNTNIALANGNLDVSLVSVINLWHAIRGTIGLTSGKWYFEATLTAANYFGIGFFNATIPLEGGYNDIFSTTSGAVLACAFDADAGTVATYLNNVLQNTITGKTSGPYFPYVSVYGSASGVLNFGQRPFAYTPPSGFKALNTQNLPTPTIAKGNTQFNPVLYTGNASTNNITGVGFETDFVWFKCRNVGFAHVLMDRVRGITNSRLFSNNTDAESTGTTYINSTNSDGFQLAAGDNGANGSGQTYVAWNWKANGTGVTNTAGSITSTVSANTTAGFSVVTYTGTGANATVGHGLGVAPRMVIVKRRSTTADWTVYHVSVGNIGCLFLNLTSSITTTPTVWNNTTPTSSVFSLGTAVEVNGSGSTYVAYCFAAIPGYSAFGSYTGNGSADGPFVYTGFRPAFLLVKRTDVSGNSWRIIDTRRSPYNVSTQGLYPDVAAAEDTVFNAWDILSNGFKARGTQDAINASGSTYIYAAFAESPFKYSLAR